MGILRQNELTANKAAANVMRITAIVFTVVFILNIAGIFTVEMTTMLISYIIGMVLLLVPTLAVNVIKCSAGWVKYLIVSCAVVFMIIVATTLTHHVVVAYVYPIAIASLYFSGKLGTITAAVTVLGMSAAQYVSFHMGLMTDIDAGNEKALWLFRIIPRALLLLALSAIFTMLAKRTTKMLGSLMGAEQQRIMQENQQRISAELFGTVTELESISRAFAASNKSVAGESETVMRDSRANTEYMRSIGENMSVISERLQNLTEMSEKISALTEKTNQIAVENSEKTALAMESIENLTSENERTEQVITQLAEHSKKIAEITKVITKISEQTNILAINASIEAGRAGVHGKGFAVVAGEVKKLADSAKKSAADIASLVDKIIRAIDKTVFAIQRSSELTAEGGVQMEYVRNSAQRLDGSNREIFENIAGMNAAIKNIADSENELTRSLTEVGENINSNFIAVSRVAAALSDNSHSAENLGEMVNNIKAMAEDLQKM